MDQPSSQVPISITAAEEKKHTAYKKLQEVIRSLQNNSPPPPSLKREVYEAGIDLGEYVSDVGFSACFEFVFHLENESIREEYLQGVAVGIAKFGLGLPSDDVPTPEQNVQLRELTVRTIDFLKVFIRIREDSAKIASM